MSDRALNAINYVMKQDGETYQAFIRRAATRSIGKAVRIARRDLTPQPPASGRAMTPGQEPPAGRSRLLERPPGPPLLSNNGHVSAPTTPRPKVGVVGLGRCQAATATPESLSLEPSVCSSSVEPKPARGVNLLIASPSMSGRRWP